MPDAQPNNKAGGAICQEEKQDTRVHHNMPEVTEQTPKRPVHTVCATEVVPAGSAQTPAATGQPSTKHIQSPAVSEKDPATHESASTLPGPATPADDQALAPGALTSDFAQPLGNSAIPFPDQSETALPLIQAKLSALQRQAPPSTAVAAFQDGHGRVPMQRTGNVPSMSKLSGFPQGQGYFPRSFPPGYNGFGFSQRVPYPPGTPLIVDFAGRLVTAGVPFRPQVPFPVPTQSAHEDLGHQARNRQHAGGARVASAGPNSNPFGGQRRAYSPHAVSDQPTRQPFPQSPYGSTLSYTEGSFDSSLSPARVSSPSPEHPDQSAPPAGSTRKRKQDDVSPASSVPMKRPQQPQSHGDLVSADMQHRKPGYGYRLFFGSRDEALKGMKIPGWSAPRNDHTIPKSQDERQQWVLKLVRAFLNMDSYQDRPGPVFKRRWLDPEKPGEGYKDFYDRQVIEKICWDVVDMAENLHRHGPKTFNCCDPSFMKIVEKTQGWTFEQRMSKLVDLFTMFKARCDKIFKSSVMETYVADPETMLSTAQANRGANDSRQKYIQEGRQEVRSKIQQNSASASTDYSCAGLEDDDHGSHVDGTDAIVGGASGDVRANRRNDAGVDFDAEGDTDPEATYIMAGSYSRPTYASTSGQKTETLDTLYDGNVTAFTKSPKPFLRATRGTAPSPPPKVVATTFKTPR